MDVCGKNGMFDHFGFEKVIIKTIGQDYFQKFLVLTMCFVFVREQTLEYLKEVNTSF